MYIDKTYDNEYYYQYHKTMILQAFLGHLRMRKAPSVEIEENEIICKCFQITESTIRSYIAKNNVIKVQEVTLACEAGGNCGSCHILIQLFIDQNKQKKLEENLELERTNSKSSENKKGFWRTLLASS